MEGTTIKYENCEDLYTGPGHDGTVPNDARMPILPKRDAPSYVATSPHMKRSYNEFVGGAESGVHNFPANNYHMGNVDVAGTSSAPQMHSHEQYRDFYAPAQHPLQHQSQQQQLLSQDPLAPRKRYRRGDKNILFGPPFFDLQQEYDAVDPRSSLAARCLSCHVVLRGHKNVSSNFLKHMKRVHPEVYKIYENIKLLKFGAVRSAGRPLTATMGDEGLNSSTEAPDPKSNQQFFDASAFLEQMSSAAACEEACPSETTENSGTPPTSTEAIETPENSRESQQQIPARQQTAANDEDEITVAAASDQKESLPKIDQTLDSKMSQMLETKLKAFVTKNEFNEATEMISNLVERRVELRIASRGTTEEEKPETAALQTQVNALQQECQKLRENAQLAQQSKRQLQRELDAMDRELRSNRLIVRNLMVTNNENPQQAVERLLTERLELSNIALESVTIIMNNKTSQQKQTLLVELRNGKDAKEIFKNCFKLKNSGIFIETEMSPFARKRKEKLLVLRKELLRRNSELKVKVLGTQLSVGGKQFYWDEVTGLCIGGSKAHELKCLTAAEYLKTASGVDLEEFLNVLQNYDVQMR